MLAIRRAKDRGYADHGWLKSFHTFSFADYYDPAHMGFRALRVINEDRVLPGKGFATHPHRDMEILSYVLEGSLAHRDSMGTGSVIRPGELQRMSAGTGVTHSEFNASDKELVHFLQIWILPKEQGIAPGYEQKAFPREDMRGRLCCIASPDGTGGSVRLTADASLYAGLFAPGAAAEHALSNGSHAWVQALSGRLRVNGEELEAGDGLAVSGEPRVAIHGVEQAEVLVFDLA